MQSVTRGSPDAVKDLHDNVTRNHSCKNMEELMAEVYS